MADTPKDNNEQIIPSESSDEYWMTLSDGTRVQVDITRMQDLVDATDLALQHEIREQIREQAERAYPLREVQVTPNLVTAEELDASLASQFSNLEGIPATMFGTNVSQQTLVAGDPVIVENEDEVQRMVGIEPGIYDHIEEFNRREGAIDIPPEYQALWNVMYDRVVDGEACSAIADASVIIAIQQDQIIELQEQIGLEHGELLGAQQKEIAILQDQVEVLQEEVRKLQGVRQWTKETDEGNYGS